MNDTLKLFEFIQFLEKAKETLRYETSDIVINKDNVASHTWQATIMNFLVVRNTNFDLDILKVIKMSLVHDFAETVSGNDDYKKFYLGLSNRDNKYEIGQEIMKKITGMLPEKTGQEIFGLWDEYSAGSSKEALFIKAAEKMESMSFLIYHGASYIDIPEKAISHPKKAMSNFPLLKGYHSGFIQKLKELYIESNIEWKEEYEVQGEFEEFKDFDRLFEFFQLAQKLKETMRYDSSPLIKAKDSVAEHMFRLAFMTMIVQETYNFDIDILKVLGIALFHEVYDIFTGDVDNIKISTGEISKEAKLKTELEAMDKIRNLLPEKIGNEIYSYWQEYEIGESKEAKLVKALDKFESISHLLYHTHTNFDEPDLIAKYCDKTFKEIPELNELLLLKKGLKKEYIEKGWEWKPEYDLV